MLDRESEIYHSGLLTAMPEQEHLAVVFTRDGVEVSAVTKTLRFEYGNRWSSVRQGWEQVEEKVQSRREAVRKQQVAFAQRGSRAAVGEPLERN